MFLAAFIVHGHNIHCYLVIEIQQLANSKKETFLQTFITKVSTNKKAFDYLGHKDDEFPNASRLSKEVFSIPMHPYLDIEELNEAF